MKTGETSPMKQFEVEYLDWDGATCTVKVSVRDDASPRDAEEAAHKRLELAGPDGIMKINAVREI